MSVNRQTMVIATGITFAILLHGYSFAGAPGSADADLTLLYADHVPILTHIPQSLGQGSTIRQVKTQYPAAISQTTEEFIKPDGVDLDVTYIRRTPLYNR